MDDKRKGSPWIAWCSAVVVLLGLYVGAYVALVKPTPSQKAMGFSGAGPFGPIQKLSGYRVNHPLVFTIFVPLERIDRHVRTDAWDEKEINQWLRESRDAFHKARLAQKRGERP